jgi:excisionase family DNA binding protein
MDKLLTVMETSKILGVSDRATKKLIADGSLPSLLVGSSRRVDPVRLADWIRTQQGLPSEPPRRGRPPITRDAILCEVKKFVDAVRAEVEAAEVKDIPHADVQVTSTPRRGHPLKFKVVG